MTPDMDDVCLRLSGGETQRSIAQSYGIDPGEFSRWLAADAQRSARARDARACAAVLWDEEAEAEIRGASDPFELSRAKELASHYRWRAQKIAPKLYGEKLAIGGASDLPPVQSVLDVSGLSTEVLSAIMKARDASERG